VSDARPAEAGALYEELGVVFEQINASYDDTVLLIARHLADEAHGIVDATLDSASPSGVTISCRSSTGDVVDVVAPFPSEPSSIDEARAALFGWLGAARDAAADSVPLTSLERVLAGVADLRTFVTEVRAVDDLTPNLREVTFGTGLDDFASIGGDQFLYVLLPPAGRDELTVGTDFSWTLNDQLPEADRPQGAYYTVRRSRPADGEIDMWFVLHGDAGPASAWAQRAAPGMPAGLWGPRSTWAPPPHTDRYLLVVDETGLGAAAAILDQLRPDAPDVHVIAETVDDAHHVELPTWDGVTIDWQHRGAAAPGTAGLLVDAVRRLDVQPEGLYALGAAESREITAVRKHLRDEVGLSADRTSMTGYWRR
jgi:NADPH-dependent ferric siderophore reductase